MAFIYTRSDLKSRINAGIQNRIGMIVDPDGLVNDVVRSVFLETDLRSAKRRTQLTPDLVQGVFPYNCPADLGLRMAKDISATQPTGVNRMAFYAVDRTGTAEDPYLEIVTSAASTAHPSFFANFV